MTTASQIHPPTTVTPCPSWCTTDHTELPPGEGFHASGDRTADMPCEIVFRLWQDDRTEARPGIVFAGQLLSEAQAHDLGLELVRAADVLRRERQAAQV
jgi:hypothetical protein